jgi:ferric-dicitrate binding protein FerR (iron transport regulator)
VVELNGEGYFEIAGIPRQPFIVVSNHQRIEVLGTMFNVNAYVDEASVKTTLLNGAVRVSAVAGDPRSQLISPRTLQPGQQSELFGNELKIGEGNPEAALAWKNGKFQFESEDIRTVMRKIARWYDIEVDYDGSMKGKFIYGTISKYQSLEEVLKMLQTTGTASFTISGRKITVH